MLFPKTSLSTLEKAEKIASTWSHVTAITRNSEVYINSLLGASQPLHVPQKFNCGNVDGIEISVKFLM